jgi:hypothetical protein
MFALAVTVTTQAQSDYSTLVVETKSGTKLEISLQKKPEVSINDKEFIIYSGDQVTSYIHEAVRKFYFKPYSATNIDAPVAKNTIRIVMHNQSKVVIDGVGEQSKVRLYSLNGQALPVVSSTSDNVLTVSLEELTPGTYILNIDNKQTFKLLKR